VQRYSILVSLTKLIVDFFVNKIINNVNFVIWFGLAINNSTLQTFQQKIFTERNFFRNFTASKNTHDTSLSEIWNRASFAPQGK
jgi:hypothetical protein